MIRDAIERSPAADPTEVAVMDAKTELQQGDVDAAQSHAETAVALDGNDPDSLIALVETHFRKLEPMDGEAAAALQALQGETAGTEIGQKIDHALVLAQGLSGQVDAAFASPVATGPVLAELWRIVESRATDDDFLRHAVLLGAVERPKVDAQLGLDVAQRLLALGFPDAALIWLGPVTAEDPPERQLAAASAELARGDARAAVPLIATLTGPEAEALRAKALLQLDDLPAASTALLAAGEPEEAQRIDLWKGDWSGLDPATPEPWLQAASHTGR